jgi:hypothetical protein
VNADMWHDLKTWPVYFQAVLRGDKTAEVRKDDRCFQRGDRLVLHEFDPDTGEFTGEYCERFVTHVLRGGQFGIEDGFVVLSISEVNR